MGKKGKKGKGKAGKGGKKGKKGKGSKAASVKAPPQPPLPELSRSPPPPPPPPPPPVPCNRGPCAYSQLPEPQYDPGPCCHWKALLDAEEDDLYNEAPPDFSSPEIHEMKEIVSGILDSYIESVNKQKEGADVYQKKSSRTIREVEEEISSSDDESGDEMIEGLIDQLIDKALDNEVGLHVSPPAIVPRKEILYHVNVLNDDGVLEIDCLSDIHPLPNCRLREIEMEMEKEKNLFPMDQWEGSTRLFFEDYPEDF